MAAPSDSSDVPEIGFLQKSLIAGGLVVALLMLILAGVYSGSGSSDPVFTGGPVDGGGNRDSATLGSEELDINPVEAFLPATGTGATCTEAVGVDLIAGFSALLTINGVKIAQEDLNGFGLNAQGVQVNIAGSSLGQFTWGPEEGCPNGQILRPENNKLEACVYRNTDGPDSCRTVVHTFDAL
ncbi:MAG: hypothetical protein HKN03_19335 [Acidimicrobiales bacterium]|nr:hypothetical protein [Acidimicrobiales bacterium]